MKMKSACLNAMYLCLVLFQETMIAPEQCFFLMSVHQTLLYNVRINDVYIIKNEHTCEWGHLRKHSREAEDLNLLLQF